MYSISQEIPHCKHFVQRKKRFCKMTVKKGEEYCGEHIPLSTSNPTRSNDSLRIVCPLDRKHTCYAHKLSHHLKICNARQLINPAYIVKGVNCGDVTATVGDVSHIPLNVRSLSNVTVSKIKMVIDKICQVYDHVNINIEEEVLSHYLLEEEIKKPEFGAKTKKHLCQTSSLLGYLQEYIKVQDDTCYVEFGAGKGLLSFWISKMIQDINGSSVLLVERASHRHKLDNKLDKTTGKIHRIRTDISDLMLSEVNVIHDSKRVVGITKHLCGDATDLSLRCLKNLSDRSCVDVIGVVMASCCHHRCLWSSYTGKEFFSKHGLTNFDFDVMCGMVSWATCGTGFSRDKNMSCGDSSKVDISSVNDRDKEIGLSRQEKEEIGKKCKNILNFGRMLYLKSMGFKCELKYYVKPDVSPENVCIVAYKVEERQVKDLNVN